MNKASNRWFILDKSLPGEKEAEDAIALARLCWQAVKSGF
jgi:hypothetical protein